MKKKILYFYEYASEIRGKCVGHARIVACPGRLNLSLAFSLQGWEKTESSVYIIGETWEGECEAVFVGRIMPSEILTVYNLNVNFTGFRKINIMTAEAIGVMVMGKGRYIKALSGDMTMTERRLYEIIDDGKTENTEGLGEEREIFEKSREAEGSKTGEHAEMPVKKTENKIEPGKNETGVFLENHSRNLTFRKEDGKSEGECLDEEVCATIGTDVYKGENCCRQRADSAVEVKRKENERNSDNSIVLKSERLLAFRTEYNPFENGRVSRCVRIGVGDVNSLAEDEPGLKENSFLMHGFYRYKHLLLAKKDNSGRILFLVLVPGLKTDKEQRLADMYGFHDFVTLDGSRPRQGVFGYFVWKLTFSL